MQPAVRAYRPEDREAVYDICVRTADSGADASGRYSDDRLMGDLFAVPYATFEPEHTHLLDDGTGNPVGYVLGTSDTPRFVRWYRDTWIAATGRPDPAEAPPSDREMLALHVHPERMLVPEVAGYPAHLHIDVLPGFQGKGWGRALMAAFLAGLAGAGVPRVHLAMLSSNTGARTFYDRLGFRVIPVPAHTPTLTFLGRDTA